LIRVEHYFEINEDDTYSHPVTFDLQKIFETQGIIRDIVEMTLGANLPLNDMNRLVWTTIDQQSSTMNVPKEISMKDLNIVVNPMQIRTFRVTVV